MQGIDGPLLECPLVEQVVAGVTGEPDFGKDNDVHGLVGRSDQRRLDQFLGSVRSLEQRVSASDMQLSAGATCQQLERPSSVYAVGNVPDGYDRGVHASLMIDLVVMALACDMTRVVSFMLDDARSDFVYNFIPMRKFSDEVPERLELIVGKMMARKPEHRYARCAEIITELQGLGRANERLSFLGDEAASSNVAATAAGKGKAATQVPGSAAVTQKPTAPPKTLPSMLIEPPRPEYWYWKFINDNGKRVRRERNEIVEVAAHHPGGNDFGAERKVA